MFTKIVANYLPQYHRIPENDLWWGEGYTDWEAVKRSVPLFEGHRQPRIPAEGYYDLAEKSAIHRQACLAKEYGVNVFGMYHFWFSSEIQLLEKPAEIILHNKDIDIEYMFIWDNGSWARNWSNIRGTTNDWAPLFEGKAPSDELSSGMLAELNYGDEEDWTKHFDYLVPFFKDERYVKINNKPVFCVFHQDNNEDVLCCMMKYWDCLAKTIGYDGIFVIGQINSHSVHFADEEYKYQPKWDAWTNRNFFMKIRSTYYPKVQNKYDYDLVWKKIIWRAKRDKNKKINFGAFVDYDDSPRRGSKGKYFTGASPDKFEKYFGELYRISNKYQKKFIFLTAWNEWGEGAYLEADTENGYSYLEALKRVVDSENSKLR